VIECVPTASELVVKEAMPLLMVPVPRVVVPSWKVTDPVAPDVIVAVKVTPAPKVDGFGKDARATAGVALFTTWDMAAEVAAV
jgi:hypothetical protein